MLSPVLANDEEEEAVALTRSGFSYFFTDDELEAGPDVADRAHQNVHRGLQAELLPKRSVRIPYHRSATTARGLAPCDPKPRYPC